MPRTLTASVCAADPTSGPRAPRRRGGRPSPAGRLGNRRRDRGPVEHVDFHPPAAGAGRRRRQALARAAPRDDAGLAARQQVEQVAAGEARGAGDEDGRRQGHSSTLAVLAARSTRGKAGSPCLIGRHHHSLPRYHSTVSRRPLGEIDRRLPAERAQLRGVEAVAAVVARPVGHRLDQRLGPAERDRGSAASGRCSRPRCRRRCCRPRPASRARSRRRARGSGRRTCSQSRTLRPSP